MTDTRTYERRITRWLDAAEHVAADGESWYAVARGDCRKLAREAGVTLAVSAGVVAAISPNNTWKANVTMARNILAGGSRGMVANVAKAHRIIAGERPLDVLRGSKVRAFYRALRGDANAVVLDRWMARAYGVAPADITRLYPVLERVTLKVAADRALRPAALQATVWVAIRGSAE